MKIAFIDCDGTLTPIKSSWEYLHRKLNLWDGLAENFQKLYIEGKIDYHEFCKRDALLWRGMPLKKVEEIVKEIPLTKGAKEMVKALKEMGMITVIVSTGISIVVDRIKELVGVDYAVSNKLISSNGQLTGEVKINVEHNRKDLVVKEILKKYGIKKKDAIAIGDGLGDKTMFEAVGLAIGFNPEGDVIPYVKTTVYGDNLASVIPIVKAYIG